ncbi:hypothetical protein [Campylobacter geochelonis]|uniref:hypothetical protein n=1 Tax=Campylobacter geochelonis TaxID=1780362 RepID=UPI0007707B9F|nr:hypothetical protein [Campylobacter geochelonis]CZE45796.1 Uncharacterised protein [Campylobacter geochelonis]
MTTKYYKCDFISDIVLKGSSNTQGDIVKLDFIPGNNFLGIVAKNYAKFSNPIDVFHSQKVKFGDAHMLIENKLSYKIPLSFHSVKLADEKINRIHLSDDDEVRFKKEQKQLKQIRNGYINTDFNHTQPEFTYSQKSSYDAENRRSKDSTMFGYSALKKGTSWVFKIIYDDDNKIKQIEEFLLGKQLLGKAKSSEYGKVYISKFDTKEEISTFKSNDEISYIYAKSRLALFDEFGTPLALEKASDLGFKSGEICFEKSYIRSGNYFPRNGAKQSYEMCRFYIEKGSVIAIKGLSENEKETKFVGKFQNEGFGEIIINPSFLKNKEINLKELKADKNTAHDSLKESDDSLINFLKQKEKDEKTILDIACMVSKNYEQFVSQKPSVSQWGAIRSFAITSSDEELYEKIKNFIESGKSKEQWKECKDTLLNLIEKVEYKKEFVKLLAMIVSKYKQIKKGEKDEQ